MCFGKLSAITGERVVKLARREIGSTTFLPVTLYPGDKRFPIARWIHSALFFVFCEKCTSAFHLGKVALAKREPIQKINARGRRGFHCFACSNHVTLGK